MMTCKYSCYIMFAFRWLILVTVLVSTAFSSQSTFSAPQPVAQLTSLENGPVYLPVVFGKALARDCSTSGLGSVLFTEPTTGESTAPYLEGLAKAGYTGLIGTPTFDIGAAYFPRLTGWERAFICNSHACLEDKALHASQDGVEYEYLSYGPERLDGVPDEEKYNLPWATEVARQIADKWNKPLILSYSTKQLHQEAEERGYDWNDPSAVVAMLAPYGDMWVIQAADEFWRLDDYTIRPILSQRVYPPGDEFRAELQRWVGWIRAANPEIKIWIQLALQRIGVEGENYPDADLLLAYRDAIYDLVDGIYITPMYGSIEQFPVANQEMVEVFERTCTPQLITVTAQDLPVASSGISLIEQGWTDDINLCTPEGDCLTILTGYYYQIYENTNYPCGDSGFHTFMILDHQNDPGREKHLFVKFPGGAVGFWYLDENGQRMYYPNDLAAGLLRSAYFRNLFFRTTVSEEYAGGVTRKFREDPLFRILVPSYCSHDLYQGTGQYNELDGFSRWGYLAAMSAVDFVQESYNTRKLLTYGGSAGAAGSFYIGKDQDNVAAIIMDSQAVDLSAISAACEGGINVFGTTYPCFCPDGGLTCMQMLAPRLGFEFYQDEPYKIVASGFDIPVYHVWNERDASLYAYLQYQNLDAALIEYNPGGSSVANMVCITDPRTPPGPICNLHVPSAYDFPDTADLVSEIYAWARSQIGDWQVYLPYVLNQ